MSWLSFSTEAGQGWMSSLYPGHGVLGADIPSTGGRGGSPVLNDDPSPTAEYRWELVTGVSAGTLTMFEDLSFIHSDAPDGVFTFTYRLFEYNVDQGTATVTLGVGVVGTVIHGGSQPPNFSLISTVAPKCLISTGVQGIASSFSSAALVLTDSEKLDLILQLLAAQPTIEQIAVGVLNILNTATIPVNTMRINDGVVVGDGTAGNDWRGLNVPPTVV